MTEKEQILAYLSGKDPGTTYFPFTPCSPCPPRGGSYSGNCARCCYGRSYSRGSHLDSKTLPKTQDLLRELVESGKVVFQQGTPSYYSLPLPRYNVALLPTASHFQNVFADMAHAHFGVVQKDYLLGPEAFAHITLCQFRAQDEAEALEAFSSLPHQDDFRISLNPQAVLRAGTDQHKGFFWVEFPVEKSPELAALQRAYATHLAARGIETLTSSRRYAPHLTLARIPDTFSGALPTLQTNGAPFELSVRPSVGTSTETGAFERTLSPK